MKKAPYDRAGAVENGTIGLLSNVEVLGAVENGLGEVWYYVSYAGKTGYVRKSNLIKVVTYNSKITANLSMANYLVLAGNNGSPSGTITAKYCSMLSVSAYICSADKTTKIAGTDTGTVTLSGNQSASFTVTGSTLAKKLNFKKLPVGSYRYCVVVNTDREVNGSTTNRYYSGIFDVEDRNVTSPALSAPRNVVGGVYYTVSNTASGSQLYYKIGNAAQYQKASGSQIELFFNDYSSISAYSVKDGKKSAVKTWAVQVPRANDPEIRVNQTANCAIVAIQADQGATIYYTIDGGSKHTYSNAFAVFGSCSIQAWADKPGCTTSRPASCRIILTEPEAPTIYLKTGADLAAGDNFAVQWKADPFAASYSVSVKKDGESVLAQTVTEPQFTMTAAEAGVYSISVTASNVFGESEASNTVKVTAHDPLTVRFVNYDGSLLSQQTVRYGYAASRPTSPYRRGYTFTGWDESFRVITADLTVTALYEINTYTVKFYDTEGVYLGFQNVVFDEGIRSEAMEAKLTIPASRVFTGWVIQKAGDDSMMDTAHVDSNMELRAVTSWENQDLPVFINSVSAQASSDAAGMFNGYNIQFNYDSENAPSKVKVIVTLLTDQPTGSAKMGAVSVSTITLQSTASGADSPVLFVSAEGSTGSDRAEITVLAVEGADRTGGLLAAAKDTTLSGVVSAFWSDWMTAEELQALNVDPAGEDVESKTQYRSRNNIKSTTTNTTGVAPAGYTLEKTEEKWTDWSSYSDTPVTATPTREVRTRQVVATEAYNQYRYGRWRCAALGRLHFNDILAKSQYGGTWTTQYSNWSNTRTGVTKQDYGYCGYNDSLGTGTYKNGKYYWNTYTVSGNVYYWEEIKTIPATYKTQYSYRDKYYLYTYYKWDYGTWSAWSDTQITDADPDDLSFEVETRQLYRYKVFDASLLEKDYSGEEYTLSGSLPYTDADLAGQKATVLVYKSRNSDPTEAQLEYVGQTVLDETGAYSFVVKTKEAPTADTGDFVVSLAVEGADGLVNIGLIEYPRPSYTVVFADDTGVISEQTVLEGEDAVVPEAPEKPGFLFTGWSEKTTNIRHDVTIVPVYKNETYRLVFVDYLNQTCEIQKVSGGTTYNIPDAYMELTHEGYSFGGWSGMETGVITDDAVLTAIWNPNNYSVTFYDGFGEILDVRQVPYGQSAALPETVPVAEGQTFYGWSDEFSWWQVTEDMNVYPIALYANTAPVPISSLDTYVTGLSEELTLTAPEGGTVYFTLDGSVPDPKNAIAYGEEEEPEPEQPTCIPLPTGDAPEEDEDDGTFYDHTSGDSVFLNEGTTYIYEGPISLTETTFVNAVTAMEGMNDSPVVSVFFEYAEELENEPDYGDFVEITTQTVSVAPEDTVELQFRIHDDPGLAGFLLSIQAEPSVFGVVCDGESLEPVISAGPVCESGSFALESYEEELGWKLIWTGEEPITEDGELVTIHLSVDPEAEAGCYPIRVGYLTDSTFNEEGEAVDVTDEITLTTGGSALLLGDINGDRRVNNADVILLFRYVMGLETEAWSSARLTAANVTAPSRGDTEVNMQDVLFLARYIVGLEEMR